MIDSLPKNTFPIKCLLVDDDADDQEIFFMALQEVDKSIHCIFADGGDALARLNADPSFLPHYIFMDINMPRMNGLECLQEIKKITRLMSVPVFMFSTSADAGIIARAKELGATDFIVKPPSVSMLSKLLAQLLNLKISS